MTKFAGKELECSKIAMKYIIRNKHHRNDAINEANIQEQSKSVIIDDINQIKAGSEEPSARLINFPSVK